MSNLLRKQQAEEVTKIADMIYDTLRDRYSVKLVGYPAVRSRLAALVDEFDNTDMVAVAVQEILERDGPQFSPMSITLARVGELVQKTRMPDDAWTYERWFRTLPFGTELQTDVEYYLAMWRDADRAAENDRVKEAVAALSRLREAVEITEDERIEL